MLFPQLSPIALSALIILGHMSLKLFDLIYAMPGDTDASAGIYLGYAFAKAGQREEAQAILNELQKTKRYVSPAELAILYAGLSEKDQAFLSLERAFEAHDVQLQYLNADPHFDSLRSDPRFADLIRRMRFPQ